LLAEYKRAIAEVREAREALKTALAGALESVLASEVKA